MKLKFVLVTLYSLIFFTAFSQTENPASRYTSEKFEKYYNAGQFDSIYAIFSPQAKISLPLDKTKAFLTNLKNGYGNIVKRAFFENQTAFAVYKTEFEKRIISLSIAADNNNAITGLYTRPYFRTSRT
ncbi:DUF3887 domain-containing protein [Chitinophaga polysaccharea]|uniref:DUF3887 domain-containing protein n=1 Tax=Chitinophaga polysaccharea TaxID=1293035 RepID=UPI0011575AA3|nr:DUF3887 domain-containing protein [Chitinophaga polysaccharea]